MEQGLSQLSTCHYPSTPAVGSLTGLCLARHAECAGLWQRCKQAASLSTSLCCGWQVAVIGGTTVDDSTGTAPGSAIIKKLRIDSITPPTWQSIKMPQSRVMPDAVLLHNGRVLIGNGVAKGALFAPLAGSSAPFLHHTVAAVPADSCTDSVYAPCADCWMVTLYVQRWSITPQLL